MTQISELSLLPGTTLFKQQKNKLKLDGSFSNFSHTICGPPEINLIKKHPQIFSSFYYLPFPVLKRKEMIFLCQFINKQSQFRNTLFLISELININKKPLNLVQSFKEYYHQITTEELSNPIASHWVRIIRNFLQKNKTLIKNPFINDVFNYESYQAFLKAIFTRWQLVYPNNKHKVNSLDFLINPTPNWKILTSSFRLEKIIPTENNWEVNFTRLRKGSYTYLITAVSETECKCIRINKKEEFLIRQLSKLSFTEYVNKINSHHNVHETLLWIKKMKRIGVVEFSEL